MKPLLLLASPLLLGCLTPGDSAQARAPMTLVVDASEAPLKLIHARLTVPAAPGPLTLVYPKWLPGEHMPSGPIGNLVGLHFESGGTELEWRRDPVEMTAFHLTVPAGAPAVVARYDFVVPTAAAAFTTGPSANAKCCVLNWNTVLFVPQGSSPDELQIKASLTLPEGWKQGGSLAIESESGSEIYFAGTSLTMLVDHPVVLGEHYRRIDLWPATSEPGEHAIDAIADSAWALDFPPERIEAYKRLVREERAVFGGVGHYTKYHWLLTLSNDLGQFGLEHHECADDRVPEKAFVDDDEARRDYSLLPHEFFHAWNGKTRRPAGLVTGGYEKPMQDELLWVYEGLTNYYGEVLGARAGLVSTEDWLETLAADAQSVAGPGRRWRPLQDTADSSPFLYTAGGGWDGYRRGTDFYAEGSLIWLDADVQIRRSTGGKKSLDDFCALFHGEGDNGRVYVKPYTAEDVFAALAEIAPLDWKAFFEERLTAKGDALPLGGITAGGWEFVRDERPNDFAEPPGGALDATGSLGLSVADDGTVSDAWPAYPGFEAGVAPGSKIIAVNGRRYSADELKRALRGSRTSREPITFILENGTYYSVVEVEYHGGERYPHLVRKDGTPDVLSAIVAPRIR
jgi:predicted metalloprotease with PDZ domain